MAAGKGEEKDEAKEVKTDNGKPSNEKMSVGGAGGIGANEPAGT